MQSFSINAENLERNQMMIPQIGSNQYTASSTERFNGFEFKLKDKIPVKIIGMSSGLIERKFDDELTFINISIDSEDKPGSRVYTAMMLNKELLFDSMLFAFEDLNLTGITLSSGIYYGVQLNDVPHGYGIIESQNYTYIGEFKNGEPVQKGVIKGQMHLENGVIISGEVSNMMLDGLGEITFANKDMYTGQFKLNQIDGSGRYLYSQGGHYQGEFKNNQRHGQGKYYLNENYWYEGVWENDKPSGKGKHQTGESEIYGIWSEGVFQGIIDKTSN